MLPCISETTDDERWHIEHGTIDLLQSNLKMRFVAPGDWIRIKFLKPLIRHARGEMYLHSRVQAGEHLMMVYFRPMRALGETSLASVFHDLHLYLCRKCELDISSQHLTVHLPHRVPVGDRYSLLDLYFACAMMERNMEAFFDDYRILQLRVITISPSPSLSSEGEKRLAFAWSATIGMGFVQWWILLPLETCCSISSALPRMNWHVIVKKGTAFRVWSIDVLPTVRNMATSLFVSLLEKTQLLSSGSDSLMCLPTVRVIAASFWFASDTYWLKCRSLTDSWVRSSQQADIWIWPLLGLVQWVIRLWQHSMMLTGRRSPTWMNVTRVSGGWGKHSSIWWFYSLGVCPKAAPADPSQWRGASWGLWYSYGLSHRWPQRTLPCNSGQALWNFRGHWQTWMGLPVWFHLGQDESFAVPVDSVCSCWQSWPHQPGQSWTFSATLACCCGLVVQPCLHAGSCPGALWRCVLPH